MPMAMRLVHVVRDEDVDAADSDHYDEYGDGDDGEEDNDCHDVNHDKTNDDNSVDPCSCCLHEAKHQTCKRSTSHQVSVICEVEACRLSKQKLKKRAQHSSKKKQRELLHL